MLRINLLPSYVAQRRLNKQLSAGFVAGFLAVVAALLAFQFLYLTPKLRAETQAAQIAVSAHTEITNLGNQAASITATVAPIQAKINFFTGVQAYNLQYIKLYQNIARFTSPKILYTGMQVAGSTLTINAYTPSIEELGRYLQVMYHEPDISAVSISSIPTPDQAAETIYEYKGTIIGVTGGTAATGGVGAGSQSGPGGQGGTSATNIPGVPPGVTVTLPPGVTLPGSPTTGPGGVQNGQPGQGQFGQQPNNGLPPLTPSGPGGPGGQGAQASTAFSAIMSDPTFNPKYWKVIVKRTDGFTFVATCTLKQGFTPPSPPGGGGPAAPNAFPGGGPPRGGA